MNKNNFVIGNRIHFLGLFLLLTIVLSSLVVAEGVTRGTTEANVCDTNLYSIPGQSGDPWVYGCVDAAHGKACKKATGAINPSFVIPNPTADATYQQLLQTCSGSGAALGVTTSSGLVSCSNPQQCKEIDEVWQRIGILVRGLAEIWDTRSLPFAWRSFNTVYVPPPTLTPTTKPTVSSTAYDEFISKAAVDNDVQVPAALLKAIIKHESGFDPWEISATGCVGLFQICTTSAKYPYITKMSGVQLRSGSADELKGVQSCCTGADCSSYRAACGGKAWCAAAQYRCNPPGNGPLEDDRFDSQRNIMSGALTVKSKMDAIPVGLCGLECQVAAYNIGEKVILAAIDAARAEIGSGPLIWDGPTDKDGVYDYITTQLMKDNGYEDSMTWNEAKREEKRVNIKGYVAKIMRSYQSYKAGTS